MEAAWALSDLVKHINNRGHDFELKDDIFVELKAAIDFNLQWFLDGLR